MRAYKFFAAVPVLCLSLAAPADAQEASNAAQQQLRVSSSSATQTMASQVQPDVLLEVPQLSVEELTLEVAQLDASVALDARIANPLKLTVGAEVSLQDVTLTLKGVEAQATLIVRLENVRAVMEGALQTLNEHPDLVTQISESSDAAGDTSPAPSIPEVSLQAD